MILKAEMQTVGDKTVIGGLCWHASDRYGLQITVGGVGQESSTCWSLTISRRKKERLCRWWLQSNQGHSLTVCSCTWVFLLIRIT